MDTSVVVVIVLFTNVVTCLVTSVVASCVYDKGLENKRLEYNSKLYQLMHRIENMKEK